MGILRDKLKFGSLLDRKRLGVLMILLVAFGLRMACTPRPNNRHLAQAATQDLSAFDEDAGRIARADAGLADLLEYGRQNPQMLASGHTPGEPLKVRAADRKHLRQSYAALLDHLKGLEGLKSQWQQVAFDARSIHGPTHARAYVLSYAAWLVQYRRGLEWVELTVPNKALETMLDEAVPSQGIERGSFARLKRNIIDMRSVGQYWAGYQYIQTLRGPLEEAGCFEDAVCMEVMGQIEENHQAARVLLTRRGVLSFGYNAWDIVRDTGFDAWFPVQTRAARWMGDTRLARQSRHLIAPEQIREMGRHLEPGDILVARSNWYLSNAGLPGFWPHSELFVGTAEELEALAEDEQVARYYRDNTDYDGLIDALRERFPAAWAAYNEPDAAGEVRAVIESRSEGVIFTSLQDALGSDYAAAMRPRASTVARARAIEVAFSHWGKPYDFNFDFLTDQELVCTELVYHAWQPTQTREGVDFDLVDVMGRTTLPVNIIVEQFDREYDNPDRSLDFVYFLDGQETGGPARVRDVAAFRQSWKRPKWGFMQD